MHGVHDRQHPLVPVVSILRDVGQVDAHSLVWELVLVEDGHSGDSYLAGEEEREEEDELEFLNYFYYHPQPLTDPVRHLSAFNAPKQPTAPVKKVKPATSRSA